MQNERKSYGFGSVIEHKTELIKLGRGLCEEASILSRKYIPCGQKAVALIKNSDPEPYMMCLPCADHNVKNRGAKVLYNSVKDWKVEVYVPTSEELMDKIRLHSENEDETEYEDQGYPKPEDHSESRLTELASNLMDFRAAKFKREGELQVINERITSTVDEMNEILTALERTKFDYQGTLLKQKVDTYPKVKPEMFDAFLEWLDKHHQGGIAPRTIHHKTLPSWYDKYGDEWAEELTKFLETFQKVNITVYDKPEVQKAQASEEYKKRLTSHF